MILPRALPVMSGTRHSTSVMRRSFNQRRSELSSVLASAGRGFEPLFPPATFFLSGFFTGFLSGFLAGLLSDFLAAMVSLVMQREPGRPRRIPGIFQDRRDFR